MGVKDLPLKTVPPGVLLERLDSEGWSGDHSGLAQEFVRRWSAKLNCAADVKAIEDGRLYFTTYLSNIRLRTMHEVPCALLGGDVSDALNDFWRKHNSPFYLPFFLTLSESAHTQAKDALSNGQCVVLSPEQIKEVLNAAEPQHQLKRIIRQQIPRRRLIPYNFLLPAEGGMFFGRREEFNRLLEQDSVNFSIAGPGRIGKTTLVKSYKAERLRARHPRASRMYYVSFYKADPSPDEAARFLAMTISESSQSHRMTADGLVKFLRHLRKSLNGPVELLLDEVDEVCNGDAFNALGEAAKMGLCRLVLCGRGGLLRTMLSNKSSLDCRLDLLQLGPLREEAARSMLLEPLDDLGFELSDEKAVSDEVLRLTGRLPHFLQLFGMKLVEMAIQRGTEVISPELLDELKSDFLVMQFFLRSLAQLEDLETRLVGFALVEENPRSINLPDIYALAQREGLRLDPARALEVCINLVVNNVLVWEGGSYHIANEGLPFYARQTGYLASALAEARSSVATLS
jgi:hypothetical protein